ncbi:DinB family protein [Fulvivirgaceae bacterium BMA12]|uniref:DinB family protein n=1 Tax=Agaribacillus aureus TaxID=3051825 RepID=A0ABT8KYQ4_9BACT|nr:DinB family protein [Fulvivirgaceae bacterium BMA12]
MDKGKENNVWRYLRSADVNGFASKIMTLLLIVFCVSCGNSKDNKRTERQALKSWTQKERVYLVDELRRIQTDLQVEVDQLSVEQWLFKPDTGAWSISEVVEHLEMHDVLFRREITVLTQFPEMTNLSHLATDTDEELMTYSQITSQNTAKSLWYLEPRGRWSSREQAIDAFNQVRNEMIRFIEETDKDFRRYYSPSGKGNADFRDLHQLMLISVAHADRHLTQIRNIKGHAGFPESK